MTISTLYEITIRIPVDPEDFSTMERVGAVCMDVIVLISTNWPKCAGIEVSKPKFIRKRVPAQITTTSAESSAQDGAGSSDSRQTDGPAADPDKLPAFLDRKVPR